MSAVALVGKWIDRIRINKIVCEPRGSGPVWIKSRRWSSRLLVPCANVFFRAVGNPVAVLPTGPVWLDWEVTSFRLLNGDDFMAEVDHKRGIRVSELPGRSLCSLLDAGELTAAMMSSAGLELRRAHGQIAPHFEGPWSHGDPHLGNFIFDARTSRTRLIDFEVRHHRNLSAEERHIEDLLVPLLDLMGRCRPDTWVPLCGSFLAAYDRPELMVRLRTRLVAPQGPARAWWAIRTGYLGESVVRRRLSDLCASLEGRT